MRPVVGLLLLLSVLAGASLAGSTLDPGEPGEERAEVARGSVNATVEPVEGVADATVDATRGLAGKLEVLDGVASLAGTRACGGGACDDERPHRDRLAREGSRFSP